MENRKLSSDELMHYGVLGMKWGQRKAVKLSNKINKINRKEDKYRDKILNSRSSNRSKLEQRYDKKIQKAENKGDKNLVKVHNENKKKVLKDFDMGTKYVTKALKIGRENKTKILELKKKSINDPSIKETESYQKAKLWAKSQKLSDTFYGKAYTTLMESTYVAANKGRSWTRGYV